MKLSAKIILPIILISALLILLTGCFGVPDDSPGYTPSSITGIIAAPCCENSVESADGETDSPEFWCYYCLDEELWKLQNGVEVILTYGEDEIDTTTTNQYGEFTFTDVDPGKNYVITAYCPDYTDDRPLVKDVALEIIEGGSFDTKITDLVSTSLGLVVDFLVEYSELGPEDIELDEVIEDKPDFPKFLKFKKLIRELSRVLEENCGNVNIDGYLQDALCLASQEIGRLVIPDLDLGCIAGSTPVVVNYTLTTKAAPPAGGTVTGGGTYSSGTTANVSATANPGYQFNGWTGDAVADANLPSTTIYMNGNKSVTANFELDPCFENESPMINSITPNNATVGVPYLGQVNATDDGTITKYELISGPSGMKIIASTGVLYDWTPVCDDVCECPQVVRIQNGQINGCTPTYVEVKVTDNCNASVQASFCITVISTNEAPEIESTPPGTTAVVGTEYTYQIVATDTDCWPDITYSLFSGPDGMTFDGTDTIDWTPTCAQIGDHVVKVRATDNYPDYTEQTFTIVVSSNNIAPVVDSLSPLVAVVGTEYLGTAVAHDDNPGDTLTFSLVGTVPTSMIIDGSSGAISGWTPVCADIGDVYVTVKVTDDGCGALTDEDTFTIVVSSNNIAPVVDSLSPLVAVVGTEYLGTAVAHDDNPGDTLTFSLVGTVPTSMIIDGSSGAISGWTPVCADIGDVYVTVKVTDDGCGALTDEDTFTIVVSSNNIAPVVDSLSPLVAVVGTEYLGTAVAHDDNPGDTLTFSLVGTVPTSMIIDGSSGAISGWTPVCADIGDVYVTVKVTDDGCGALTDEDTFTIVVSSNNIAPVVDSLSPLVAVVGTEYLGTAVAHDDNPGDTLTFSLVGTVPTSMIIDGSSGAISGWTPVCADIGDVYVTVKVTDDGCGALTDEDTFTIVVSSNNIAPVVDSLSPLVAVVGTEYLGTAVAHDDNPGDTLTFSLVGTVPTSMIIDGSSGAISGWTPVCADIGDVYVTVKVTDDGCGALTDEDTFTIVVSSNNIAPVVDSLSPLVAVVGTEYLGTAVAHDDNPGDTLTFSLVGTVPTSMIIDGSSGAISGWTPSCDDAPSVDVTVKVTDDGCGALTHQDTFTIVVSSEGELDSLVIDTYLNNGSKATTYYPILITPGPTIVDVKDGENSIIFTPTLVGPYSCSTIRYRYKASGDDNYGPWYEIADGENSVEFKKLTHYSSHNSDPNIIQIDAKIDYLIHIYRGR